MLTASNMNYSVIIVVVYIVYKLLVNTRPGQFLLFSEFEPLSLTSVQAHASSAAIAVSVHQDCPLKNPSCFLEIQTEGEQSAVQ